MTNTNSTLLYRHFHRIAWLAVALATCVIVFGAFVRLSNAGLSCPDWPTCYGKAAWPTHADQIVDHMHAAYERLTRGSTNSLSVPRFGAFISGPSKTADIEQTLVVGAHGPRSLVVCFLES